MSDRGRRERWIMFQAQGTDYMKAHLAKIYFSQKIYSDPKEKVTWNFRPCDKCINTLFLGGVG